MNSLFILFNFYLFINYVLLLVGWLVGFFFFFKDLDIVKIIIFNTILAVLKIN